MYSRAGFKPNFGKDVTKAKEYSKIRYNQWKKNLSSTQVKKLEEFKSNPAEINSHIKKVHGDMDQITDVEIKKKIADLDEIIKKPENKTKEKQTIYTHFDPSDLGYKKESNMTNETAPNQLDGNKISNILKYKFSSINEFKVSDLTMSGGEKGQRFVAEVELPVGTYLGHLGNGQTVLPSDYGIVIKQPSIPGSSDRPKIIVENGKQVIKVKAKLVKKAEIKKKLNTDKELVKLDIKNGFESHTTDNAKKAVGDLLDNIPRKLAEKTYNSLNSIVFTDEKVADNGIDPIGVTVYETKYIGIQSNHWSLLTNKYPNLDLSRVLLHEFGHAVDGLILNRISQMPKFKVFFDAERENLTELVTREGYGKTSPAEFFAEVFQAMYSTSSKQREAVKKEAPKTVKYIEEKIKEYTE
ncbi:ADP-ribosyltransferase [Bacillus thuringiensis]|nr:ADP-ribosyltransferase [Bacillus thuringiensis]